MCGRGTQIGGGSGHCRECNLRKSPTKLFANIIHPTLNVPLLSTCPNRHQIVVGVDCDGIEVGEVDVDAIELALAHLGAMAAVGCDKWNVIRHGDFDLFPM